MSPVVAFVLGAAFGFALCVALVILVEKVFDRIESRVLHRIGPQDATGT